MDRQKQSGQILFESLILIMGIVACLLVVTQLVGSFKQEFFRQRLYGE